MREYFISDENKRYEEHSAAREHGRSAEYFRGEEVYRSPEFPSEGEKKSGASRRRTRVFTDRLLAGGIAPVVCAVAGGTVIAAAVVVAMAIKITVLAAVLTMTGISVDFKIEHVGSSSLVLTVSGGGFVDEIPLSSKDDIYSVSFAGLQPGTDYLFVIEDGEGGQLFSEVYSTLPYEATLTVMEKSVMPQSILLQFEEVPDTQFKVTLNGKPVECSLSEDFPVLAVEGLLPEGEYEILVADAETGDWLYREMIETPYMVLYDFSATARQTVVYTQAFMDMADGQYVIFRLEGDGRNDEVKQYYGDDLAVDFTGLEPGTTYTLQIENDRGEILSEKKIATNPVETTLTATVVEETLNSLTLQFEGKMGTARMYDVYIDGQLSELKLSGQDGLLVIENLEAGRTYSVVIRDEYNYDYLFIGQFATPAVIFTFLAREVGEIEVMVTFTLENPDAREVRLVLSSGGVEQASYSTAEEGALVAHFSVPDLFAEYQLDVYLDDGTLIYSNVLEEIQTR